MQASRIPLVVLAILATSACGKKSSTAPVIQNCVPPDYTECPNYPPATVRLMNQSASDSSVELGTMLPTPGSPRDTTTPLSDTPIPGHETCQLLGRWQPDSAVLVVGFSGFNSITGKFVQTSLGLYNLRGSPGWTARFDGVWHFSADTACRNPEVYTF